MESIVDNTFTDWSEPELKELRDLHSKGKSVYDISQKMRRTQSEIISQIQRLGMSFQSDVPKERVITKFPDLRKQHADDLPEIGNLLTKMINDLALLHLDATIIETKIGVKTDELISAVKGITELHEEFMKMYREQYLVWKQKQNPPPTN